MYVGEPLGAAAVQVRQQRVVQALQVQDVGMQVMYVYLVLHGRVAEVVGGADYLAPLGAPAEACRAGAGTSVSGALESSVRSGGGWGSI